MKANSCRVQPATLIQTALRKKLVRSTARSVLKITTNSAAAFLAGCALFGFNPQALAATDTWVGSTSNNWADSNWNASGNNPPQTGDSLVFGAAGVGTTLVDNLMTPATYTINGVTFNSGAAAYTITSGTVGVNGFTLAGPLTNASASLQTIRAF